MRGQPDRDQDARRVAFRRWLVERNKSTGLPYPEDLSNFDREWRRAYQRAFRAGWRAAKQHVAELASAEETRNAT